MKYKAVFIDVDGTLIKNYSDDLPSPRVTQAIAKAREKGVHVGIVTGRWIKYLHPILDHLQLEGPSVITNGTQVIDSVTKEILWDQALLQEDIEKCIAITKNYAKRIKITEDGEDIDITEKSIWENPLGIYIESLPENEADELINELKHIATISPIKFIGYKPHQSDVWISHVSATKQHGLVKAAEILDISRDEIIGIGDAYNDFSLMMASGLKVAMGNAIEDLKAIADYVAPTVEEDGVADVIEKFVLKI